MKTSIALLLSGLAAQQVAATGFGWNRHAPKYPSPQNNDNECSDRQKGGFNWSDVPTGGFSGYGDFNFGGGAGGGGWTCANSFGKRDSLTKRTFNSKCIKNSVGKQKPASFDCGNKKKNGFSVNEIQVSVEFDCDLEFHYKMPDNSICKHVAPCKKEGTTVKNTQCGGAQSVDVYLGNHGEQGKESCEIGFHHIGFDCNPGYTPKSSTVVVSTPAPTPSQPAETPSIPAETPSIPAETPSISAESTPVYSIPVESQPVGSTPVESVPYTTPGVYTNSSSAPIVESTPVESTPVYSTLAPETTTAGSPPAETPGYTPTSESLPVASAPAPSSPATPPGGCPPVLPQCMNTWLEINTECKDNTDVNCYCKNPDFAKSVIDCVAAWSTDKETQDALTYLVGICASYVPQNPGLITDCPSTVPIGPTNPAAPPASGSPQTTAAPTAPSAVAPPPEVPQQTITVTVPCSSEGTIIPGSSTVSTVTVPQVIFTTATPGPPEATSEPVNLVPGTPAPAPAVTTAPYPLPSGMSSVVVVPTGGNATASQPAQFTGAASPLSISYTPALMGAVLALFAW